VTHDDEPTQASAEFTVEHDHGILVVEALGSSAEHEDWDVTTQASHIEPDSLFVAVLPSMEGAVTTSVRWATDDLLIPEELHLIVDARLAVPSRTLLIGDSDRNGELRVAVPTDCGVAVFVDEPGFATRALVVLKA
jgi:hypothetical protein